MGDIHLLAGAVHEEERVIYHSQLKRNLLDFFRGVMIEGFRALADLTCRSINTIGQDIADPFPPNEFFKKIKESLGTVGGEIRQLFVGQYAGFVKLDGEGENLGRRESVQSVGTGKAEDVIIEVYFLIGRHAVGKLVETFQEIFVPPRIGNRIMTILRTVIATRVPGPHFFPLRHPLLFTLFVPVTFSPRTRIAPGEIVDMETFVMIVRHGVAAILVVVNFLILASAHLPKLGRSGDVDVLGATDNDRL